MLSREELNKLKRELSECSKPLYLFDDDGDGVAAFIFLYKFKKEGKGVLVKARPELNDMFAKIVNNYGPDRVIILDVSSMNKDFKDLVKTPISWIDHHDPQEIKSSLISYYNPRVKNPGEYSPTSLWIYEALHEGNKELEDASWIAAAGCIWDHAIPDFIDKVEQKYPYLLPDKLDIDLIKYHSPLGKIARMFYFLTMGATVSANRNMKVLTRIKDPKELLEGTTSQGKFLLKNFEKLNKQYENILHEALKVTPVENTILFIYSDDKISVTKEIANELSSLNKDKLIIVGREKSGEFKMSLRYDENLKRALEKALENVEGYGGGHEMACGACVKSRDFDTFLKILKDELGLRKK